jgi:hypothetical protein
MSGHAGRLPELSGADSGRVTVPDALAEYGYLYLWWGFRSLQWRFDATEEAGYRLS